MHGVISVGNNVLIEELKIENYRGLNNVTIPSLSHINIFVGNNNCGKTSVLEAVKLLGEPTNIGRVLQLALLRAHPSASARIKNIVQYVTTIFQKTEEESTFHYHYKIGAKIKGHFLEYAADGTIGELTDSLGDSAQTFDMSVMYSSDNGKKSYYDFQIVNGVNNKFAAINKPNYEGIYLHSELNYYRSCCVHLTDYITRIGKEDILQILNSFDPNITDISIVGEDIYLHSNISGTMPLFSYGLGLQKAVLLTSVIVYCKNGVILVDEIDNAIHVSAFEEVFRWFAETCLKYNVQAFITTHSVEAIDAIVKTALQFSDDLDPIRVYTMRKSCKKNTTFVKARTGREAYQAREQFRMELRV